MCPGCKQTLTKTMTSMFNDSDVGSNFSRKTSWQEVHIACFGVGNESPWMYSRKKEEEI